MLRKILSFLRLLLTALIPPDRKAIPEVACTAHEVHERLIEVLEHQPHHILLAAIPTNIGLNLSHISDEIDKYWTKHLRMPIMVNRKESDSGSLVSTVHFGHQFEPLLDLVKMEVFTSFDPDDPIVTIQVETVGGRIIDFDYAVGAHDVDTNVKLLLRALAAKAYANASTMLQTLQLLMRK